MSGLAFKSKKCLFKKTNVIKNLEFEGIEKNKPQNYTSVRYLLLVRYINDMLKWCTYATTRFIYQKSLT